MAPAITGSALSWLRETESLRGEQGERTLKKAYWERLECEAMDLGLVLVRNESYADPMEHCHEVSVDPTGEIVYSCSCPQFIYRGAVCKHMVAVAMALDSGELARESVCVGRGSATS